VTVCWLPEIPFELSPIVSVPELGPEVGVEVMLIVQLAPAATEAPQVLVCAKGPDIAMLLIWRAALPVFLRVTICGKLV